MPVATRAHIVSIITAIPWEDSYGALSKCEPDIRLVVYVVFQDHYLLINLMRYLLRWLLAYYYLATVSLRQVVYNTKTQSILLSHLNQ